MHQSKTIQKPLAKKRKWAFLFSKGLINRGTFQTALSALQRRFYTRSLYTTLYELPLIAYIAITCDKTLEPLKKVQNRAPKWLLEEVYESIMKEYAILSDNKDVIAEQTKRDRIETLQTKIVRYTLCGQVLAAVLNKVVSEEHAEEAVLYLKNNGVTASNLEGLFKRVETSLKNMTFQLKQMTAQSKQEKKETGEITRADYEKIIVIANKNGHRIDDTTTVARFITILNVQRQEHEDLEKLKAKK